MTSSEIPAGSSGYFSAPSETLDPNLFYTDSDILREEVRQDVAGNFFAWMSNSGWRLKLGWTHLWLTGSGVSYQWEADRGNGDLDVMVSIDVVPFIQANPEVRGWGEDDIAQYLTMKWREDLWPRMANTRLGERVYEVTYYWNPGTGDDIRHIHPYAAVDVLSGEWVVHPPRLSTDPTSLYPVTWYEATQRDYDTASALFHEYGNAMQDTLSASPATRVNANAKLAQVTGQARALYDDIHLGRHGAFTDQGEGYGDFRNFRWQRAKQMGHAAGLHQLASVGGTDEDAVPKFSINPAERAAMQSARWRTQG